MFGFGKKKNKHELTDSDRSLAGITTQMRRQQKETLDFIRIQQQQKLIDMQMKQLLSGESAESGDPFSSALKKELERDSLVKKYIQSRYGIDPDDMDERDLEDDTMPDLVKEFLGALINKKKADQEPTPDVKRVGKKLQRGIPPAAKKEFSPQEESAIQEIVNMFFKGADKKTKIALKAGKKSGILGEQTFVDVAAEAGRRIYKKL